MANTNNSTKYYKNVNQNAEKAAKLFADWLEKYSKEEFMVETMEFLKMAFKNDIVRSMMPQHLRGTIADVVGTYDRVLTEEEMKAQQNQVEKEECALKNDENKTVKNADQLLKEALKTELKVLQDPEIKDNLKKVFGIFKDIGEKIKKSEVKEIVPTSKPESYSGTFNIQAKDAEEGAPTRRLFLDIAWKIQKDF